MTQPMSNGARPVIIGHRGYSARYPENTLVSLRAALDAGVTAVEWDVRVAACGTPVLMHDSSLGRTTNGVGPVQRRTAEQLSALDAGRWFSPEFEGEPVPTLRTALHAVRERAEYAFIEVKGYRELEDIDRIVSVVEAERGELDARIISLDWAILDRVLSIRPGYPVAFIAESTERVEAGLDRARREGAALSLDYRLVLSDPGLVARAADDGVPLSVWTVNDEEAAERVAEAGIRWITTDEVERMLNWAADRS